ncbi:MAG: peptidoglycan DD-metalloendopeptidase family protein [Betaproteobacteria bacterium]|nr:peptidoglycan DD-metalloendopeptidase family protein [Betaproteobacteria bacterium]
MARQILPAGYAENPKRWPARALLGALLALLPLHGQGAKQGRPASPATAEVAEKQSDLKDLRAQIEALRKDMASAESTRADAADQLKDAEREISITQRELHNLAKARGELRSTVKDLGAQSRDLESRLGDQQSQLEQLLVRQYLQGNPDALRLLLSGNDPNQVARDLYYLAAIGRARSRLLREVESTLHRKQTLAARTGERAEQLAGVEARQKQEHDKLLAQREQRKAMLEKISAKIAAQRKEIGSLERDEKRLSLLIERLARIIAEKPAPRSEAPRKEMVKPAKKRSAGGSGDAEDAGERRPATEIASEHTPEALPAGNFAQLKGKLRLPVRGTVGNRFGAARQEGSTWKGLFIRAAPGSEVKTIAGGRVVFAEWMRGFGNLLIVDHGSGYLTIYGNNDSLLKQVGDAVRGGETIASAGNSGGNPESGLYFELRHQGQPLDPLKWVNIR